VLVLVLRVELGERREESDEYQTQKDESWRGAFRIWGS